MYRGADQERGSPSVRRSPSHRASSLYGKISIPKEDKLSNYWTGGYQIFREEPFMRNEFLSKLDDNLENILSEKDVDI